MRLDYLILTGLGILFFLPFLGNVHLFDWDEINFAECAREMLATGDWLQPQIDFEPFWEKPPLFFWMQALSMKLFGVNEFAARFPNVLAGITTLLVVYKIGASLHGRVFGWIWAMGWVASLLPHLYFRSGIIDPW
ncbi:MAG: ArnT family glycosyltransferase, partial [Bacteroidota bacterium]